MDTPLYRRITYEERVKIEGFLDFGRTVTEIAKLLDRPRQTINREIKAGLGFPGGRYVATSADFRSNLFKRIRRVDSKIFSHTPLRHYLLRSLCLGFSPEQISGRLRLKYPDNPLMHISHESIYKYIYSEAKGLKRRWLINQLTRSRPKRSSLPRRKIYMGTIKDRTTIDKRPEYIENREEVGHWEGDLVIGKDQKSAIGTLVERKLRYTMIIPLKSKKSEHVVEEFAKRLNALPQSLRRTLTYDNGVEFTMHKHFTELTNMPVYFAHPYSSWERGTNENTNGLIRRVYKKKTDFRYITKAQWKELEGLLNTRPRKILSYKTPVDELKQASA
jgi:transposase, IS30 family